MRLAPALLLPLALGLFLYLFLDIVRRSGDVSTATREALDTLVGGSSSSLFSARGKHVLITGASSGIGEHLAYQYCRRGAHVVIVARRENELERVRKACDDLRDPASSNGATTAVVVADAATAAGWKAIGDHVAGKMGNQLDLLVLNAGISMGSLFSELRESGDAMRVTKKLMDVNYLGSIGPLEATLPALLASPSGVRVAVVSSLAGTTGVPLRTAYSASKFALQGFFEALRRELAIEGEKAFVTMIYPGVVKTGINRVREGVAGQVKQLDMTASYDVEPAAAIMVRAIAEGRREVTMSTDGSIKGLLTVEIGKFVKLVAPSLIDKIVIKTAKQKMMSGGASSEK